MLSAKDHKFRSDRILVFKGLEAFLIRSWGRTLVAYHPPLPYTNPQYTKSSNIDLLSAFDIGSKPLG
jgi:hypothetical protein